MKAKITWKTKSETEQEKNKPIEPTEQELAIITLACEIINLKEEKQNE